MRTKLIALIAALMLFGVAACGDDDTDTDTSNDDVQDEEDEEHGEDEEEETGFCTYTFTDPQEGTEFTIELSEEQDERNTFIDKADEFLDKFDDDYDSDSDSPAAIKAHVDNTDGEKSFEGGYSERLKIYDESGDAHDTVIAPDWATFRTMMNLGESSMPDPQDSDLDDLDEYNDLQDELRNENVDIAPGFEEDVVAVIEDHVDSVAGVQYFDEQLECD